MSGSSGTSKGHVYELDPPVLADGLVELQSCSAGTQFILTSRTKVPKYIFGLFKEHGTLRLVYVSEFLTPYFWKGYSNWSRDLYQKTI